MNVTVFGFLINLVPRAFPLKVSAAPSEEKPWERGWISDLNLHRLFAILFLRVLLSLHFH